MNDQPSTGGLTPFAPTRWTLVLRARGDTPEARAALGELCEAYWNPVFRFLRREGRDDDTARELTQEFFARVLAGSGFDAADPQRGLFRSYLLGAVKHFLADLRERDQRLKRGGGEAPASLDSPTSGETSTTLQVPDPAAEISDLAFDREWALAVMDRALNQLERDLANDGKQAHFDLLKPWLVGAQAGEAQADVAARLGMSEGALKVAIHRMRKRFGEIVKNEIAQTVNTPEAAQEELRYLIEVLSRS